MMQHRQNAKYVAFGCILLHGVAWPHRDALHWLAKWVESAAMPFEISTTRGFSAAHQLRLYDGSLEPVHGHNWKVKVVVQRDELDEIGVVMDFHELERLVDRIIEPMQNRHLNELTPFDRLNPSAEHVAMHIGKSLRLPKTVALQSVEVWETDGNSATYRP